MKNIGKNKIIKGKKKVDKEKEGKEKKRVRGKCRDRTAEEWKERRKKSKIYKKEIFLKL